MQGRCTHLALSLNDKPFLAEAPAPSHCCPGAYSPPAIARNPSVGLRMHTQHIIPNHKALMSYISQFTAAGHVCLSVWL